MATDIRTHPNAWTLRRRSPKAGEQLSDHDAKIVLNVDHQKSEHREDVSHVPLARHGQSR